MDYQKQIEAYFAGREEELVAAASRLMRINSTRGEAEPGKPYGPGPAACLEEAVALAGEMGLTAANYDGYVCTADLNDKDTALHILAHLDVVDGGDGWTVTGPFEPKVADGLLYGRGSADDKGPAAAALLAMKAVKDLNIPLKHNARVVLGTDEECGSSDLAYYFSKEPYAPYSFTPDAEFPVINVEKGRYSPTITKQWEASDILPRVISFQGGTRLNMVPAYAEAVVAGVNVRSIYPLAARVSGVTGTEVRLKPEGENVRIQVLGKNAHAMEPEKGHNAQTALLLLLCVMPMPEWEGQTALYDLYELLRYEDTCGEALGIKQEDELSGALTVTFSMLTVTETGLEARFDSRTPVCANVENCQKKVEAAFAKKGFTCTGDMTLPHHTPADSPFVQILLKRYEEYTGQKGECLATGGGTYVHNIPGGVAFGAAMPGFENNMHGPDEKASVQDLMTAAKLFAQVIIDLCA